MTMTTKEYEFYILYELGKKKFEQDQIHLECEFLACRFLMGPCFASNEVEKHVACLYHSCHSKYIRLRIGRLKEGCTKLPSHGL